MMSERRRVVSSFWHGAELPPFSRACMRSFIRCGFQFDLYAYRRLNVPEGVQLKDAAELFPEARLFFYRSGPGAGSVSAFTNIFRYKFLAERGGMWVDTDVFCLRSDWPDCEVIAGWQDAQLIGNAVLRMPAGHWLAAELFHTAEDIVSIRGEALRWGEIGPNLLTTVVKNSGTQAIIRPSLHLYPVGFSDFQQLIDPVRADELSAVTRESYCVHLWAEMFRRAGLDPSGPPAGSFLAQLYGRHGDPSLL